MKNLLIILLAFFLTGCQTAKIPQSKTEKQEEAVSALSSVAQALSGQELDEDTLSNLKEQAKDPQAQSAMETISSSLRNDLQAVKYCPVDRKRYSAHLQICPEHKVELKEATE